MNTDTNRTAAEEQTRAVIVKNEEPPLTDDEKIDMAAARILERFRPAFEELAK